MVFRLRSKMSRSTTMHGVGSMSFVMSRKSRRAMRDSNSENGKGDSGFEPRAFRTVSAVAAAAVRKERRVVDMHSSLIRQLWQTESDNARSGCYCHVLFAIHHVSHWGG